MTLSRRELGRLALTALPAAVTLGAAEKAVSSKIAGVQIGAISYSFRDLPATQIVPSMVKVGLSEVELMSNHAEALAGAPAPPDRGGRGQAPTLEMQAVQKALQEWRMNAKPTSVFSSVKKLFADAGIDIRLVCYNMGVNITDEEIDYAFRMAQALGAKAMSSSSTVT